MNRQSGELAASVATDRLSQRLALLTLFGFVILVGGALASPSHGWPAVLLLGYFVFSVGVGAMYFVSIHQAARAGWATVFKRVPEAMLSLVPVGGLIIAVAVVLGGRALFPWLESEQPISVGFKGVWLSPGFFYLRTALYLVVLSGFAWQLHRESIVQDEDGDSNHSLRGRRLSIGFLVLGSVILCLASFDWFMSAEPHWYSTMYGVYHFAGNFLAGLAVITMLVLTLRGLDLLKQVNQHHLHDLGKLLFAISTFWMYIWFSQFMLIWYTNFPEETTYFTDRMGEGKTPLFLAVPLLQWAIPFFVLLSQRAKKSGVTLGRICVVFLLGHWLDLFVLAGRQQSSGGLAIAEVGAGLAAVGIAFLVSLRQLQRTPLIPLADPYLKESLHHHS